MQTVSMLYDQCYIPDLNTHNTVIRPYTCQWNSMFTHVYLTITPGTELWLGHILGNGTSNLMLYLTVKPRTELWLGHIPVSQCYT